MLFTFLLLLDCTDWILNGIVGRMRIQHFNLVNCFEIDMHDYFRSVFAGALVRIGLQFYTWQALSNQFSRIGFFRKIMLFAQIISRKKESMIPCIATT